VKKYIFRLAVLLVIGMFISGFAGKKMYKPDNRFFGHQGSTLVCLGNDELWVDLDTLKPIHLTSFEGKNIMIQWECGQVYTFINESGKVFTGAHGSMPYEEPSTMSLDKTLAQMRVDYGRPIQINIY
jgi:hypothetical protein